jgi:hypothetical protein
MKMSAYAAPALSHENSRSSSPNDVRNHYHSFGINLKTSCRKTMAEALETSAVRRLAAPRHGESNQSVAPRDNGRWTVQSEPRVPVRYAVD